MRDRFADFVSYNIYKFEYNTLPPLTGREDNTEKYINIELSKENFKKFCTYIEKNPTKLELNITIYDEGIVTNSNYKKARENLIKTLNNTNIRSINFILSNSTISEYNKLMKIFNWKHKDKTKINMIIDRNPISKEIRDWNLHEAQGTVNISEEKLIWLSDYQLEQLHGIIDERILKNTIELKKLIIFIDKYFRETYQIEKMNDFDKVYLIYKFIKTQISFPWKYVNIINEKEVIKTDHPTYMSEPYGTWINKEGSCEGQARLMNILLNNPLMKINSTTIDGEIPQGKHTWVGIVLNNKLYACCTTIQVPFKNLDNLGYTVEEHVNNKQVYPIIYEHAYLSKQKIKRIERKIKKLKKEKI